MQLNKIDLIVVRASQSLLEEIRLINKRLMLRFCLVEIDFGEEFLDEILKVAQNLLIVDSWFQVHKVRMEEHKFD